MAKRDSQVLLLACIGVIALADSARAQGLFTGTDGCAVLAQLVYSEVTSAAWNVPGHTAPTTNDVTKPAITTCNQTTRTVSKAFTAAMAITGSEVRWGYPSGGAGDACLSGFLEQCYPDVRPFDVPPYAWIGVSKTVQMAMPRGVATDHSEFSHAAMRLALRSSLRNDDRERQLLLGTTANW